MEQPQRVGLQNRRHVSEVAVLDNGTAKQGQLVTDAKVACDKSTGS